MNSVSWFIYIAQVSNSLSGLFLFLGGLGLFVIAVYISISTMADSIEANAFKPRFPQMRYMALIIGCLLIGNMLPEKNTLYAIAASQVGEHIVKTEIASDATKALHQWIKKQIEPEVKK